MGCGRVWAGSQRVPTPPQTTRPLSRQPASACIGRRSTKDGGGGRGVEREISLFPSSPFEEEAEERKGGGREEEGKVLFSLEGNETKLFSSLPNQKREAKGKGKKNEKGEGRIYTKGGKIGETDTPKKVAGVVFGRRKRMGYQSCLTAKNVTCEC